PDDNDNAASDITYTLGAKITATVLHKEDPSFPDNQLDNRFALIGDGSWEADTTAEFPEAVGKPIEMSVMETSEELRAGFEESMRRVRARGVEEEEDERREAEEKARIARWREAEWEREKAAEAERMALARREASERVALAQSEWEEERERSEEEERRREEAADEAAKEGTGDADAADSVEVETNGTQVSQLILCMPSPKRDAPSTTRPRGGKPAFPKTPAGSSDDDHVPDSDASHTEDAKWRRVEGAKRRKREEEKVMKVNARVRGERAAATGGKSLPAGRRLGQLKNGDRRAPVDFPLVLDTLLASATLPDIDVVLLQEPPRKIGSHPLPSGWKLVLPTPHPPEEPDDDRARSCILISPTFQPADVRQRPLPSRDLVNVELRVAEGESVRLLSLYNPSLFSPPAQRNCTVASVLPPLLPSLNSNSPLLLTGNFNLRHPSWDPLLVSPPSDEAETARLTLDDAGLVLLGPPGEPTFFGSSGEIATLDLALGNLLAKEQLISAQIDETLECRSDHRPIRISLLLNKSPSPGPPPRRLHRKGNAADRLAAYADALHPPSSLTLETEDAIEEEAAYLTLALQAAAETAPLSKSRRNPRYANPWWSEELNGASEAARKTRNRLARLKARGEHSDERAAQERLVRCLSSRLKALVRREKVAWERKWVEETTIDNLWRRVKSVLGRGEGAGEGTTPPLRRADGSFAVSVAEKRDVLRPVLLPTVHRPPPPSPNSGNDEQPSGNVEDGAARDEGLQVSQIILCMTPPSSGGAPSSTTPRGGQASMTHVSHTGHHDGRAHPPPPNARHHAT
ncbi:hypothetical protein JCM11251_000808, partial [Rhodosporidiobolus azoricus]